MGDGVKFLTPDQPQLYNGMVVSYGIIPILNALAGLSKSRNRIPWTLYLVNVETIIRDRKTKEEVTNTQMIENVITDITVMAQYIASYNSMVLPRGSKIRAMVCFYMNKYENLPHEHIRDKLPKGTEDRWKIRNLVAEKLKSREFTASYEDTDILFFESNDKIGYPHKELAKELMNQYEGLQYRKTLMISHVPLDFHLYKVFDEFTLLESYTGAFKTKKDFGKKVFQLDSVPFNKYTHLLLGDKWYIKQLVDNKTKKLISDRAEKESWNVLPDKEILKSLISMNVASYAQFVRPDI